MTLESVPPEPVPAGRADSPPPSRVPSRNGVLQFLRRAQKYSAYGFLGFAGLHLTATVVLPPLNAAWAESAFMAGRSVYQTEIGEAVLVYGSIGVHVASGAALHAYRLWIQYRDSGAARWRLSPHAVTGWALTGLAALHVAAMRWAPVARLGDSSLVSLDYAAYGLHKPWVAASVLALCGVAFAHIVPGLRRYGLRVHRSFVGAGALWSGLAVLALRHQDAAQGWMAEQFETAYKWVW